MQKLILFFTITVVLVAGLTNPAMAQSYTLWHNPATMTAEDVDIVFEQGPTGAGR